MVRIKIIDRAVGVLRTNYNRCFGTLSNGRRTSLGRSSSFAPPNPEQPSSLQSAPASKRRKQGRVKRKRYDDLARGNTVVLVPGGFPKDRSEKTATRQRKARDSQGDNEPINCNPNKERELITRELNTLVFDKSLRENWFEATAASERAKAQATERKVKLERGTEEAEMLQKMEELERREQKERAESWKDARLAQLEKEKENAKSELAREKIDRMCSRLRRGFQEQERKRRNEERFRQLVEQNAKTSAEREKDLLRENAILRNDLEATGNAFQTACNEREHMKQMREEERTRRLRAEESLRRWKEVIKDYFPGRQHPGEPQEQPQPQPGQPPSPRDQFELYETKWAILRSGVDFVDSISFSEIPWPVVGMVPTHPSHIQSKHIKVFFLIHPHRVRPDAQGKRKTDRQRIREELAKWHSDKFNSIVLPRVREEDKAAATEAAGLVARVFTSMLN